MNSIHSSPKADEIHMLVLETDETHPETQQRKGSFGDVFNELFQKAGGDHEPPLKIKTSMHFVVEDPTQEKYGYVPDLQSIPPHVQAVLVTGSMYDAHGSEPWILKLLDLLTQLWKTRPEMKFSGVCFGHQLLSRMLGAKVESTPGGAWELAYTKMEVTPVGQKLFRTTDTYLSLHQMHQDQVTTVPSSNTSELLSPEDNVHVWASTSHTKIQGLYIRERLFTSQGHLGFDENMVHRQIEMRQESGGIKDDQVAEEAKETAHMKHDGVVVAAAILRFFHGDDHDVA